MKRILLVAATQMEIAPTLAYLSEVWSTGHSFETEGGDLRTSAGQNADGPPLHSTGSSNESDHTPLENTRKNLTHFYHNETELRVLITGVGLPATAFALGCESKSPTYHLAIQAGIAGAIDRSLVLGQLVRVSSDRFADLGAEDQNSRLIDLQDLGFLPEGPTSPFHPNGTISPIDGHNQAQLIDLPSVSGISVNKVHGSSASIDRLRTKYPDAQIESMEGAAFFYACRMLGWPALQLRGISNYVEPRNKENWEIGRAVKRLNEGLISLLEAFSL
ncbi:MAG: futalosine hydrolase [Bacteroidota bacterium]